jgi:archaellum component FlaC
MIEIEKIDDRIAAIEEDIRAERDRLRGHLIESAQDGSSTAKSALEHLDAAAKKAAKKLNPVERVKDIYEIANAVKDVPSRAGEFKNIPDRINRWRSEIEDLEASRQRLERELENLRNTRSEKFPRQVPAYDRRAE